MANSTEARKKSPMKYNNIFLKSNSIEEKRYHESNFNGKEIQQKRFCVCIESNIYRDTNGSNGSKLI